MFDTMYSAQTLKDRIKTTCAEKGMSMTYLLGQCGLGINAIRQISDTKGISCFALANMADVLGVSMDYLVGRVDSP